MTTLALNGKLLASRKYETIPVKSEPSAEDRLFHSRVASIFAVDGPFLRLVHNLEKFYGLKPKIFANYPSRGEALRLKKAYREVLSQALIDFVIVLAIMFERIIKEKVYDLDKPILKLNTLINSIEENDRKIIGNELLQIKRIFEGDSEESDFSRFITHLEESNFDCFSPLTEKDLEEFRLLDLNFFGSKRS